MSSPYDPKIVFDRFGHALAHHQNTNRLGMQSSADCLVCGRTFKEPLDVYVRERCTPNKERALRLWENWKN
jgi:succinate dehydrogenase/fumarate reductase flavoprotein subunit